MSKQDGFLAMVLKEAGVLTQEHREDLPKKDFAVPKATAHKAGTEVKGEAKGAYPIPDASHARNALSRVSQFGSSTEKAEVRAKVHAKFPDIGEEKKASLDLALGKLWLTEGPGQTKHAAANYFSYGINKDERDEAILTAKFCKVARIFHRDPWDHAAIIAKNLSPTSYYVRWADEMIKRAGLGSQLLNMRTEAAPVLSNAAKIIHGAPPAAPVAARAAGGLKGMASKAYHSVVPEAAHVTPNMGTWESTLHPSSAPKGWHSTPVEGGPRANPREVNTQQVHTPTSNAMPPGAEPGNVNEPPNKPLTFGQKVMGGGASLGLGLGGGYLLSQGASSPSNV